MAGGLQVEKGIAILRKIVLYIGPECNILQYHDFAYFLLTLQ